MERLPRDQPSSAPGLPKSPQPTLTTVPVEIRTAIFQECFIGAEISHHYVHHKATDHYAILLTCRQFYEDGIDTYNDSLTLVVGEKGLEYFSLLQTMVERVQYVRCDEIHQSLTRHMWAGLAQSLKHFLKLKKFDLGSSFRYILHVSKSLTKDVTDGEILKAFGKRDFDVEEIRHVVRGMAGLAVTFNVYVVTSREEMQCELALTEDRTIINRKESKKRMDGMKPLYVGLDFGTRHTAFADASTSQAAPT